MFRKRQCEMLLYVTNSEAAFAEYLSDLYPLSWNVKDQMCSDVLEQWYQLEDSIDVLAKPIEGAITSPLELHALKTSSSGTVTEHPAHPSFPNTPTLWPSRRHNHLLTRARVNIKDGHSRIGTPILWPAGARFPH